MLIAGTFMADKVDMGQAGTVAVATAEGLLRAWWYSIVIPPPTTLYIYTFFKKNNKMMELLPTPV